MDSRWRNLVILVVILIIAAGAYLFLLQPKALSFEDGYNELSLLWEEKGITIAALATVSDSKLDVLKSDLLAFRSRLSSFGQTNDTRALDDLVSIQLDLVEEAKLLKQLEARKAELAALDDSYAAICANIGRLKGINAESADAISFISGLNGKINSFIGKYPSQASSVGMDEAIVDTTSMEQALQEAEDAVIQMEAIC